MQQVQHGPPPDFVLSKCAGSNRTLARLPTAGESIVGLIRLLRRCLATIRAEADLLDGPGVAESAEDAATGAAEGVRARDDEDGAGEIDAAHRTTNESDQRHAPSMAASVGSPGTTERVVACAVTTH